MGQRPRARRTTARRLAVASILNRYHFRSSVSRPRSHCGRRPENRHGARHVHPLASEAKRCGAAVVAIGDHRRHTEPGIPRCPHLTHRELPHFVKPCGLADPHRRQPVDLVGPIARHLQVEDQGPHAERPDRHTRYRDLAFPNPALRPTAPPPYPHSVSALLGENGIVDNDNSSALGHRSPVPCPRHPRLPRRVHDEIVQSFVADRIHEASLRRLHGLPFAAV